MDYPKILEGIAPAVIAAFVVWAVELVGAVWGGMTQDFASLCEAVRMFSSEIEYSEENLYAVLAQIEENAEFLHG